MKTKFFKKLSFVLAVAMVLSVFAPAAGAFAAKAPKLNSTKKYLHLDVEGKNKYDFNISNKQKGWKYYWESSNEDVAEVNEKNGLVTATGAGTAKISVTITDKNGEEVDTLKATVVVRDNIKTVKITNLPENNKLAVGKEHDFNRSYVTVSGRTKGSESVTRWTVEPADKATIDDKGIFKANEAGKYTITARSFQSKAKYEAWAADPDTYKDYVLAQDSVEITVAASMVEAKQVDKDTVKVTFDSAVEDVDKNINVYQVVGNAKVKQIVKEVAMSEDKKTADVTVYLPFVEEATYVIEYPEMDDVSFVAARKNPEDVAYIKLATTKAVVGNETELEAKLFNANDVDISDGDGLLYRVTFEVEDVNGVFFDGDKTITVYEKDKSAKVTATYHSYKWNENTGEEIGNLKDAGVVVGVDADTTNVTGLVAWTIVGKDSKGNYNPNFDDVKHILASEDEDYRLFVKVNTLTGTTKDTANSKDNADDFSFETSNEEVLIIASDGTLYPNKQGTATVIVKYGKDGATKKPVATVQITVGPKAKASVLTLGATDFTLSNVIHDTKVVTLKLTDQNGRAVAFDDTDVDVTIASGNKDANKDTFVTVDNKKLTFDGFAQPKGKYSFKVTIKGVTRYITVNVVSTDKTTIESYKLEVGANKVDVKAADEDIIKNISIDLYGVAGGVKIEKLTLDGPDYKVEVDAPAVTGDNWDYTASHTSTTKDGIALFDGAKYKLATTVTTASGSAIVKAPTGNYKVTAYKKVTENGTTKWKALLSANFVVEDTQDKPVVTKIKDRTFETVDSTSKASVLSVASDCFEIKLNGEELTNFVDVEYSGTDEKLYIRSITVRKDFALDDQGNTAYIDFKVSVGTYIVKK